MKAKAYSTRDSKIFSCELCRVSTGRFQCVCPDQWLQFIQYAAGPPDLPPADHPAESCIARSPPSCLVSACAAAAERSAQWSHTRFTLSEPEICARPREHRAHTSCPHERQWWRRRSSVHELPQMVQPPAMWSACQSTPYLRAFSSRTCCCRASFAGSCCAASLCAGGVETGSRGRGKHPVWGFGSRSRAAAAQTEHK